MSKQTNRFWEEKSLEELSDVEWESLCDGCGRCCLQKLEDIDTAEIYFTSVACKLLDLHSCRCSDYPNRIKKVPDCTMIRPLTDEKTGWLPETCAYRLIAQGEELPPWHPLVSGSPESVHEAGISVRDFALSEGSVDQSDYPKFVINLHDR